MQNTIPENSGTSEIRRRGGAKKEVHRSADCMSRRQLVVYSLFRSSDWWSMGSMELQQFEIWNLKLGFLLIFQDWWCFAPYFSPDACVIIINAKNLFFLHQNIASQGILVLSLEKSLAGHCLAWLATFYHQKVLQMWRARLLIRGWSACVASWPARVQPVARPSRT